MTILVGASLHHIRFLYLHAYKAISWRKVIANRCDLPIVKHIVIVTHMAEAHFFLINSNKMGHEEVPRHLKYIVPQND